MLKNIVILALVLTACTDDPNYPINTPGMGPVVDAPPLVERSCHNGTSTINSGIETLIVRFNCGNRPGGAGEATTILVDPVTGRTGPAVAVTYKCDNNVLTFSNSSSTPLVASEIVGQEFDIFCD